MIKATTRPHDRTTASRSKSDQARAGLTELLAHVLSPGFYGAGSLTVTVQDGHVQQVKISAERTLR